MGSYALAISFIGIIELFTEMAMPGAVFFVAWPIVSFIAFTVQVWLTSPDAEKNREETRRRYHDAQAQRFAQASKQKDAEDPLVSA